MNPEIWTYELQHFLPFSPEVWVRTKELHNATHWVVTILGAVAGIVGAVLLRLGRARAVHAVLALAWGACAAVWFADSFGTLVWAGRDIAILVALQAAALAIAALMAPSKLEAFGDRWAVGLWIAAVMLLPVATAAVSSPRAVAILGSQPEPTIAATFAALLAFRTHPILWAIPVLGAGFVMLVGASVGDATWPVCGVIAACAFGLRIRRRFRGAADAE